MDALLSQLTLAEKIGQMTQVDKNSITPDAVAEYAVGSVLSGGGGSPPENSPRAWLAMVNGYLAAAAQMRVPIPVLYGVDAVHGHSNVRGATIFPHNAGLGATRDPDLLRRIGRATAVETAATGIRWTFAPAVSVAKDVRWGRTFESFSEDVSVVTALGRAYIEGLHGDDLADSTSLLPSVKHYLADGATSWMTPEPGYAWLPGWWERKGSFFTLDQGVAAIDEATLRREHLAPYAAAVAAGALNVMASYSSWGGLKMHAQKYLLTDVLKGELGFDGFIVSDWLAVDQLDPDYYTAVVRALNAGIDMVMVPFDYQRFIETTLRAVKAGDIAPARIDDAAGRILRAKRALGLFGRPLQDDSLLTHVGSAAHRRLAREAAQKSAVLLKNDGALLPLPRDPGTLLVAGAAADDIGRACGGWSITWQGSAGATTPGTTLLQGIRDLVGPDTAVLYAPDGGFDGDVHAELGVVVLHEEPYAEGYGDRDDLSLSADNITVLTNMAARCERLVAVIIAGRPLIITDQLNLADAWVMAWLPGTEGDGIADVLFGAAPFTGRLPFTWPRTSADLPQAGRTGDGALFPLGHGLHG